MGLKYLVTGAAGFIGSTIVRALLHRGEEVRGLDNFDTGKRANIDDLLSDFDFVRADVRNAGAMRKACRGIDVVFHEAAIASVQRSIEDPLTSFSVNITGTANMLRAAHDAGVNRFVYAGTSAAYGNAPELPKRENQPPCPVSPYAISKVTAEEHLAYFHRRHGLETVVLRYFNVYGPRQDPSSPYSGVLPIFISKMLQGQQPTIRGDGEQSRDFVYVDDCVQANLLAATAPSSDCAGKVFNVGVGEQITINRLYRELQAITGYTGRARLVGGLSGDIRDSVANISAAQKALGYVPQVSFSEGLRRTVDWYKGDCCEVEASADATAMAAV